MSFVPCGACPDCLKGEPMWCAGWLGGGGGFAQYGKGGHLATVKLPEYVLVNEAALIQLAAVGLHAVRISGMKPNARVLVIGAGPIALATIYWARRRRRTDRGHREFHPARAARNEDGRDQLSNSRRRSGRKRG